MQAGKLNRRITIQQNGSTQDANGELVVGWVNLITTGDGTLAASIVDITGSQYVAAGSTGNNVQTKIGIRYLATILPKMRVLHGATVYDIEAVLGQDKRSLVLMCKRIA